MQALFDKELTEMEREVLELKTIHQRGLGTVRFYEAEVSATISGSARFVASLESGEAANPLALSLVYGEPPLENFGFAGQSVGLSRWISSTNGSQNIKVKFISSSAIDEITQS